MKTAQHDEIALLPKKAGRRGKSGFFAGVAKARRQPISMHAGRLMALCGENELK
jgi:hypothetical protein